MAVPAIVGGTTRQTGFRVATLRGIQNELVVLLGEHLAQVARLDQPSAASALRTVIRGSSHHDGRLRRGSAGKLACGSAADLLLSATCHSIRGEYSTILVRSAN